MKEEKEIIKKRVDIWFEVELDRIRKSIDTRSVDNNSYHALGFVCGLFFADFITEEERCDMCLDINCVNSEMIVKLSQLESELPFA